MVKIVRYDPFKSLINRSFWSDELDDTSFQRGLKIREDKDNIFVEAVVAGVPSDQVEVHIEDGVLTIKAEKNEEEKKENQYHSSSYQYYYTCALSGGAWNKAKAEVDHGILTVTIPKAEVNKPKKILVKTKGEK